MRAGTQKNAEEAGDLHLKTRFHGQMSDTFHAAVFVTLSGGFQDAYTYSLVTEFTDIRAIWVCCGLLLVSFALMFVRDERES